jgi:hypothetical protein
MRPLGWRDETLHRYGTRVLAGTDPLPCPGDEVHTGRFATCFDAPFDPADPLGSLIRALRNDAPRRLVGSRCAPWTVLGRMRAMRKADRT